VPPEALREFVRKVGVARAHSVVDVALLEATIRETLNPIAERRMAVLRPLKLVIENYPEGETEVLSALNHPDAPERGVRPMRFGREVYIEQDDFMEDPPRKFFRLAPGREVRLRYAYLVTCREVVKGPDGRVSELRCVYDPGSRGGNAPDGRKVQGTLHWVAAADAVPAEVRLYEHLFTRPDPGADGDLMADLNPNSLTVLSGCLVEPALARAEGSRTVQFERQGYFCRDRDSSAVRPVFNRTIGLRDTWARQARGGGG
jgi:glutaminyl-tRNA synthetase